MTAREEIARLHSVIADAHARLAVLYQEASAAGPPGGRKPATSGPRPDDEPADVNRADLAGDEPPEKPPSDGRQLLGWAAQQRPDAMPRIKSWGAAKKIKAKILDWTPDQVRSCYQHVRGTRGR